MSFPARKTAVVFDFDGTLTQTDTTKYLLTALLIERPYRLGYIIPPFFRYWSKKISPQEFKLQVISSLLHNLHQQRAENIGRRFATFVKPFLRTDIVKKTHEHLKEKQTVIIATASPRFAVECVFLNQEICVLGTEFELIDGKYSGKCLANCYGVEKARGLQKLLFERGLERLVCAYSDHYSDLPLLEMADQALLVYPDINTKQRLADRRFAVIE